MCIRALRAEFDEKRLARAIAGLGSGWYGADFGSARRSIAATCAAGSVSLAAAISADCVSTPAAFAAALASSERLAIFVSRSTGHARRRARGRHGGRHRAGDALCRLRASSFQLAQLGPIEPARPLYAARSTAPTKRQARRARSGEPAKPAQASSSGIAAPLSGLLGHAIDRGLARLDGGRLRGEHQW